MNKMPTYLCQQLLHGRRQRHELPLPRLSRVVEFSARQTRGGVEMRTLHQVAGRSADDARLLDVTLQNG